jgi:hypothetical protein
MTPAPTPKEVRSIIRQRGPLSSDQRAALCRFIHQGPPRGDISVILAHAGLIEQIALRLLVELEQPVQTALECEHCEL